MMKRIIFAALVLSLLPVSYAAAAGMVDNAGADLSAAAVIGIHAEANISAFTNDQPISAQVFLKNYNWGYAGSSWNITAVGMTGLYDFSSLTRLDQKAHPYAGGGLMSVMYHWNGGGNAPNYTGVGGGLYFVGGIRYDLTPEFTADANLNNFGGLTVGLNYDF